MCIGCVSFRPVRASHLNIAKLLHPLHVSSLIPLSNFHLQFIRESPAASMLGLATPTAPLSYRSHLETPISPPAASVECHSVRSHPSRVRTTSARRCASTHTCWSLSGDSLPRSLPLSRHTEREKRERAHGLLTVDPRIQGSPIL